MFELTGNGLYVQGYGINGEGDTGHNVQALEFTYDGIVVRDPWLGEFEVADPLIASFHGTANAIRAMGVSQLCKTPYDSTIPNLADLTREECVIAQVPLVEHFGRMQGLSLEEMRAIHIGIEGDDQTHMALSHVLELPLQGWGGQQNFHEKNYGHIARLGGTADVLDEYRLTYDSDMKVKDFRIPEWAHASEREDLDIDRYQYIAAEAYRWFDNDEVDPEVRRKVKEALSIDNFTLTEDGVLAFKHAEHALVVSKLMMLFANEHWSDPVNRAHAHLLIHGVNRSISKRWLPWMDAVDNRSTRRFPYYYYGIDNDFAQVLHEGPGRDDETGYLIGAVLRNSGREERSRFSRYRRKEYSDFIKNDRAVNYPSEYLSPQRVNFGPRSLVVDTQTVSLSPEEIKELKQVKVPKLLEGSPDLTYIAGPFKERFANPQVQVSGGFRRLSEVNPAYRSLLRESEALQSLGVRVTFAFVDRITDIFRKGLADNEDAFVFSLENEQMTPDQQARLIEDAASRAFQLSAKAGRIIVTDDRYMQSDRISR